MKVLVSGCRDPNDDTVTEYTQWAIRSLRRDLVVYNDDCRIIPGRIRSRIAWLEDIDFATYQLSAGGSAREN
jgi:hypothetical protein